MGFDVCVTDFQWVVQREPDPQWGIQRVSHTNSYVLAYAITGTARYEVNGRRFAAREGDAVWFPKGLVHSARSDQEDPWKFCSVGFDCSCRDEESALLLSSLPNHLRVPNPYHMAALMEELVHEWNSRRIGHLVRCRSIIEEALFRIVRWLDAEEQKRSVPHLHAIRKVARLLETEYAGDHPIPDLAARAGLSVAYFRKLFKQVTGFTPVQYQHQVRVNRAKDLLLSGECNVSEAAFAVGFENIYYFSRLFKKVARVNPSDYLRR